MLKLDHPQVGIIIKNKFKFLIDHRRIVNTVGVRMVTKYMNELCFLSLKVFFLK